MVFHEIDSRHQFLHHSFEAKTPQFEPPFPSLYLTQLGASSASPQKLFLHGRNLFLNEEIGGKDGLEIIQRLFLGRRRSAMEGHGSGLSGGTGVGLGRENGDLFH
jgi:hypothetical protein